MPTPVTQTMTNTSSQSSSYPNDAARVAQMVITVLIFVVGVTLNGLVVWVLGVRCGRVGRGGSGSGETRGAGSFRVYVVNLALADLVLLLRTPLMLGYLAHHFSWPFGLSACRMVMFFRCLGLYVSAFLLCAVALERCLCLLRPVWASIRRPRWAVPLACALLWALATALSAPYISEARLVDWKNRSQCIESRKEATPTLTAIETAAGFILPLVIFMSCNVAVLVNAKKTERNQATPVSSPGVSPTSPTSPYVSQRLARLYRVLFITMLLFLTCWVPYFTFRFLRALSGTLGPEWAEFHRRTITGCYVALFLVYVKSALNPILYVFAARGLGRTVRATLLSAVERVFNDETTESLRRKSLRRRDSEF
ncbi:C3a anaphylatoxin chemotactic receptor [Chanos chanos]|uniref:C3a anaphylatoxin chemotactic receptor n=1 Tax=Chanos chanos TaxID=29144 RepID=A0A6J2VPI1_CHACN|nr:C3a anaphylatoxin chemotactic receptor-like [Chanos chanos]